MNIRKKKWKIYSGILLTIIIFLLFLANSIINGFVENEITNQLNNNPNSLYEVQFDKINTNIYTGSINVKNLSIQPVDSVLKELSAENIKKLLSAEIQTFKIKHINIFQFLRNSKVEISAVVIKNMMVDYYFPRV